MEDFKDNFRAAISSGDTNEITHLMQSLQDGYGDLTREDKARVLGQGLYDVVISPHCTVDLVRQLIKAGADVNHTDDFKQSVLLKAFDGSRRSPDITADIVDCLIFFSSRRACFRTLSWLNL